MIIIIIIVEKVQIFIYCYYDSGSAPSLLKTRFRVISKISCNSPEMIYTSILSLNQREERE